MKTNSPTHEEVAQRAHAIWQTRGSPSGCDTAIWFEAEQQLTASQAKPPSSPTTPTDARPARGPESPAEFADRVKAETASESAIEYLISPSLSEDDAVQAALQTTDPRGAKLPAKPASPTPDRGSGQSQSRATPAADPKSANPPPAHPPTHPVPAPSPGEAAAKALQQKNAARAPHLAAKHPAHTPAPPESGKPLWDKPHSS